jgi:hypothetical protein
MSYNIKKNIGGLVAEIEGARDLINIKLGAHHPKDTAARLDELVEILGRVIDQFTDYHSEQLDLVGLFDWHIHTPLNPSFLAVELHRELPSHTVPECYAALEAVKYFADTESATDWIGLAAKFLRDPRRGAKGTTRKY